MEKEIRQMLCKKCLKQVRDIEAKKQKQRRKKQRSKVSSLPKKQIKK